MMYLLMFFAGIRGPLPSEVAVYSAYAMVEKKVEPVPAKCCAECKGKGFIVHGDGHRTFCICPEDCVCKKKK